MTQVSITPTGQYRHRILSIIEAWELPIFGPVYRCLFELINPANRNFDFPEIIETIKMDQVLTAKILAQANLSAGQENYQRIQSVEKAVMILGISRVQQLLINPRIIAFDQFEKIVFDIMDYWAHSMKTAHLAREIALIMKFEHQEAEDFFYMGLLHDIGKLLLSYVFNRDYIKVVGQSLIAEAGLQGGPRKGLYGKEYVDAEREIFGLDHAEVSAQIVEKMGLKAKFQFVIRNHHNLSLVRGNKDVQALFIADMLAKKQIQVSDLAYILEKRKINTDRIDQIMVQVNKNYLKLFDKLTGLPGAEIPD
ncbi:MAG: HDOD domain-containing protein [Deltaproteobacteria bacterium]|nr:HDOD domain-containing protein [Deltaproteobacteria bacterium]